MADPGLIRAIKRRAKIRKSRAHKRTLGPLPPLRALELWYTSELVRLSREVSQAIRAKLFPILEKELRTDADTPIVRVIETVRIMIGARARTTARRLVRDVEIQNRENMNTQFKRLVGINVWSSDKGLSGFLNRAIEKNIDLIESIPQRQLKQVESVVREGIRSGTRVEAIMGAVEERFRVSESRARLIARDQVGKLNGQLAEKRQRDLGVTRYVWAASMDERTRDMHRELDGSVQLWSDPPVTNEQGDRNHPGEDYQCRCSALAVIEDVLESLGI